MKVLLFASFTELLGCESLHLELEDEITVLELLDRLEAQHPQLKGFERKYRVAVNQEFANDTDRVCELDEVALIPPVSGGSGPYLRSALRDSPILVNELPTEVMALDCGAVVSFMGTVRDLTGELVTERLEYSAYLEMAEKKLDEVCRRALARWPLGGLVAEHRVGELQPGEVAVMVCCSAPHRKEAFEACRFVIDTLKDEVPIWKKEFGPEGEFWPEK